MTPPTMPKHEEEHMDINRRHAVASLHTYPHPEALRILPGCVPPRAVAVPLPNDEAGEYEYVRYDCATLTDLERAVLDEATRPADVLAAVHADRQQKLAVLRPLMADYPTRTVLEACELLWALEATRQNVERLIRK